MTTCLDQIRALRAELDDRLMAIAQEATKRQIEHNCLVKLRADLDRIISSSASEDDPVSAVPGRKPIQKMILYALRHTGFAAEAMVVDIMKHTGAPEHAVKRTITRMQAAGKIILCEGVWYLPEHLPLKDLAAG